MRSFSDMRRDLKAQAEGGVAGMDQKVIERVKGADDGLKELCERYRVKPVIVETIQRVNGNESMHGFEITWVPIELVPPAPK